jgi:hypothetical protein
MALHAMAAEVQAGAANPERDVGRLFVCCDDGVHAFDLAEGRRTCFSTRHPDDRLTGLAVTEDGTRLFATAVTALFMFDTRTRAVTMLSIGRLRYAIGCVIDSVTRSLVICDHHNHTVVRMREVDV